MTSKPRVSVCIANYNGMDVIDDCIRSVQEQQGDIPVEILIHDDASTDASVSHIQVNYPQVRLIVSEANVGFCIANNRMATAAQGEYLLLLNNDAALYPDALQTLLEEAVCLSKPAILTLPQYDATTGDLVDRGCLLDPFYNPVPNLNPERQDVAMVIGACMWVPKQLWDELEGFPEWFGSIAEDMYLCCRARLAGYAVRALSASGYRHWQGMSFGGGKVVNKRLNTTLLRRELSERNKTFVLLVSCPAPWLVILLLMHLSALALEGAVLSLIKRNWSIGRSIYIECFISLWRFRLHAIHLRHAVQKSRIASASNFATAFKIRPHKLKMLMRYGIPDVQT